MWNTSWSTSPPLPSVAGGVPAGRCRRAPRRRHTDERPPRTWAAGDSSSVGGRHATRLPAPAERPASTATALRSSPAAARVRLAALVPARPASATVARALSRTVAAGHSQRLAVPRPLLPPAIASWLGAVLRQLGEESVRVLLFLERLAQLRDLRLSELVRPGSHRVVKRPSRKARPVTPRR